MQVRPTSDRLRETLFNVIAARVPEARFLDLCAGSGAVGIEVGEDSVALHTESGTSVERKVTLPERWVRCFLQAQAIQRKAKPCAGACSWHPTAAPTCRP